MDKIVQSYNFGFEEEMINDVSFSHQIKDKIWKELAK